MKKAPAATIQVPGSSVMERINPRSSGSDGSPKKSKKPKRPVVPESAIQAACLQWLAYHGVKLAWRQNTGGARKTYRTKAGVDREYHIRFAVKGCSDILGILPGGRFLAVEVKRADGKASADQADFLRRVNEAGGLGIVVRSVDELSEQLLPHVRLTQKEASELVDGSPLDT